MKLFILFLLLPFSLWGMQIGEVRAVKGIVKLKTTTSIKKINIFKGYVVKNGDMLITSKDAFAKIRMKDNSLIILDKNSIIHFLSLSEIKQESGKIYYHITSKKVKNSLHVKTNFAIIGIKGTVFIVKADRNKEILLQKGLVGISSIKEEFKLYKKRVNKEFNRFKASQNNEFERYKNSHYEKARMTKSFDLHNRNKVQFDGDQVREDSFGIDDVKEFKYFEQLINEI